jgi:hypothetical protein
MQPQNTPQNTVIQLNPTQYVPNELSWKTYKSINYSEKKSAISDLLILEGYRKHDRIKACNGTDPMEFLTLYAQDELAYRPDNTIYKPSEEEYRKLETVDRLNKFGQSYNEGTPIYANKLMADIITDVAIDFYNKHGLKIRVYDCLRTVDSAFLLYRNANNNDRQLLAKPGKSAHNMGMAIDITVIGKNGEDIERVDHNVLDVIKRNYKGDVISDYQKEMRLELERGFHKAAYKHGIVTAPLPSENWDFRFPENLKDPMLHRVVESLARCTGQHNFYEANIKDRKLDFNSFKKTWEVLNKNGAIDEMLGVKDAKAPSRKNMEAICYSNYQPIYDKDLLQKFNPTQKFTIYDAEIEMISGKTKS